MFTSEPPVVVNDNEWVREGREGAIPCGRTGRYHRTLHVPRTENKPTGLQTKGEEETE